MNPILIFKGDSTDFNNNKFLTINLETEIDLTGFVGQFVLGNFQATADISSKIMEIVIPNSGSNTFNIGTMYGVFKLIDTKNRYLTVSNTIPFTITSTVFTQEPENISLTVPPQVPIEITLKVGGSSGTSDYNELTNRPTFNGTIWQGPITYDSADIASRTSVISLSSNVATNTADIITLRNDAADLGNAVNENTNTISKKQNMLTAGENITIVGDVISASGSVSSDYEVLTNKPKVNNVELVGNKTLADLNIAPADSVALKADQTVVEAQGQTIVEHTELISNLSTSKFDSSNLIGGKDIQIIPEPPAGGIDQYTILCCHFDDNFLDSSLNPIPNTATGKISNNIKKFGLGSLDLNFTNAVNYEASDSTFELANQDWTIDFWYYQTSSVNSSLIRLTNPYLLNISVFPTIQIEDWGYNSGIQVDNNVWQHIAFVHFGNFFYIFKNGEKIFSIDNYDKNLPLFKTLTIMVDDRAERYLDELRFSKGIARWTDNFTPPQKEYTLSVVSGNFQIDYIGATPKIETYSQSNLPDATTKWLAIVYVSDKDCLAFSNGIKWIQLTGTELT